jgi:ribosome maturation protein SDO1
MRVRVSVPAEDIDRLREKLLEGIEKVESEEKGQDEWEGVCCLIIYADAKC